MAKMLRIFFHLNIKMATQKFTNFDVSFKCTLIDGCDNTV